MGMDGFEEVSMDAAQFSWSHLLWLIIDLRVIVYFLDFVAQYLHGLSFFQNYLAVKIFFAGCVFVVL